MTDSSPRQISDSSERPPGPGPRGTIEMPAEKAYFLLRAEVLQEAKDDLASWFRRRFWIGAVAVTIVGYFGVATLTTAIIRASTERAFVAAIEAEQQAKAAGTAVKRATEQADAYSETVAGLKTEAARAQLDLEGLRQRIQADTGNVKARAEQDVASITGRLRQLEEFVAKIAAASEAGRREIETYRSELTKLRTASQAERQRFVANSEYRVTIYYTEGTREAARKVQERLVQEGYRIASDELRQAIQSYRTLATLRAPQPTANTISSTRVAAAKAAELQQLIAPIATVKNLVEFEEVATVSRPQGVITIRTAPNEIYVYLVTA